MRYLELFIRHLYLRLTLLALVILGSFAQAQTAIQKPVMEPLLSIQDLMNQDGSFFLFRNIDRPYIKGFQGIVTRHTGRISYSIDPLMYVRGAEFRMSAETRTYDPHILIARQKLSENLDFISTESEAYLKRSPLKPDTRISEFWFQYEVEIRTENENVINVMRLSEFKELMKNINGIQTREEYFKILQKLLLFKSKSCSRLFVL